MTGIVFWEEFDDNTTDAIQPELLNYKKQL